MYFERRNVLTNTLFLFVWSLVRSQLVSMEFFIDIKSFRSHYGPGVDSASNRNEYQDHFLEVMRPENPSDRTMALGSIQPLKEMSTRSISWR